MSNLLPYHTTPYYTWLVDFIINILVHRLKLMLFFCYCYHYYDGVNGYQSINQSINFNSDDGYLTY